VETVDLGALPVDHVELIHSQPGPKGSRYTVLTSAQLGR
jgi:2'-5' RNA ligase